MLYELLYPLRDTFSALNVFQYITFRAAYATITALLMSFLLGPYVIARLRRMRLAQVIRDGRSERSPEQAGDPDDGGDLDHPLDRHPDAALGESREQVGLDHAARHGRPRAARVPRRLPPRRAARAEGSAGALQARRADRDRRGRRADPRPRPRLRRDDDPHDDPVPEEHASSTSASSTSRS